MTAATSRRSPGTCASRSIIEAMRQHVVGGEVLGARIAHVDALDPPLEVLQLQLDQVGGGGARLQLEGIREEEALEAPRALPP